MYVRSFWVLVGVLASAFSLGAQTPPAATDLGTLTPPVVLTGTVNIPGGATKTQWLTFDIPAVSGGAYLDIDTNGGTFSGTDTMIALFGPTGTLIASDDDSGPSAYSSLSLGSTSPTRAGVAPSGNASSAGSTHSGQNGTSLPAGRYYLAITGYSASFSSPFAVTTSHTRTGDVAYRIAMGLGSGPLVATAIASPTSGPGGSSFVAQVTISSSNPVSTGVQVSLNASAVGAGTRTLRDDGVAPDAVAGDGVFSATVTVATGLEIGTKTMTYSVTDAQGRSASGNLAFSLIAGPCDSRWLAGAAVSGTRNFCSSTTGSISAVVELANGDLIIGGSFTLAGGKAAPYLARWNGAVWLPVGNGATGVVYALLAMPNGDVVAAVQNELRNGTYLRRWNGTTWATLGETGYINALALMPNGDIVAAGRFSNVGGVAANNIARWNGSTWAPLGSGLTAGLGQCETTNPEVFALAVMPNGDLMVGGNFGTAGGVTVKSIARWDGNVWFDVGGGVTGFGIPSGNRCSTGFNIVRSLLLLPSGDLIVGGEFLAAGGVPVQNIARWNGTIWSSLAEVTGGVGPLTSGYGVYTLGMLPNGDIIAGGNFTQAGGEANPVNGIARFNGLFWSALGTGLQNPPMYSGTCGYYIGQNTSGFAASVRVTSGGIVVACGNFVYAGDINANNIAFWDGNRWSSTGDGISGPYFTTGGIAALAKLPNGDLVAAGDFSTADGQPAKYVARWNGTTWSALGEGTIAPNYALTVAANGDVVAAGTSYRVGPNANGNYSYSNRVARWNGAAWSTIGELDGNVRALTTLPNGDIVAAGSMQTFGKRIVRWNGQSWLPFSTGLGDQYSTVYALAVMPNGDLIAGGQFGVAGGVPANNIARWDGTSWRILGNGVNGTVYSLLALPNGDLIAGGRFDSAGGVAVKGIARWNGTTWSALGTGLYVNLASSSSDEAVRVLVNGPNGEVYAGGSFFRTGDYARDLNGLARWDGAAWQPLNYGVDGSVFALAGLNDGELAVGGSFLRTRPSSTIYEPSSCFARYSRGNVPSIVRQPVSQSIASGGTLVVSAEVANGYSNVTVQWRRNGVAIANGPGGASAGGGLVLGGVGSLPSPTLRSAAILTIQNARCSDAGEYTAVFSSSCSGVTSVPAVVSFTGCATACPTDYNLDAVLNLDDLSEFITDFYTVPAIPGGLQPLAPTYSDTTIGYGVPCPDAGDPPAQYATNAYRVSGYRVGFSADGSNACPADPGQTFPNLDNLSEFITEYYAAFTAGGC